MINQVLPTKQNVWKETKYDDVLYNASLLHPLHRHQRYQYFWLLRWQHQFGDYT